VRGEVEGRAAVGVLVLPDDCRVVLQVRVARPLPPHRRVEALRLVGGGGVDQLREHGARLERRPALALLVHGGGVLGVGVVAAVVVAVGEGRGGGVSIDIVSSSSSSSSCGVSKPSQLT
jgi:hypothetical protein